MKKLLVLPMLLLGAMAAFGQAGVIDAHKQAMDKAKDGDMDKALSIIQEAEVNFPDNLSLLKDEAFINTWKKDYVKAIEVGKKLIASPDADVQCYQILGSAYRADSKYAEAERIYKDAVEKFPENSLLYAELGDALKQNSKPELAKTAWEKGIEVGPSISSNYYFLTKFYAENNNPLWSVLYGEMFVNFESFSGRTTEIRGIVTSQYAALFATPGVLQKYVDNGQPFEKAVAMTFQQFQDMVSGGVTPESLYALRGQFIVNWFNGDNGKNFSFKLFDRQQQLLKLGIFEAYNQWLFASYNQDRFNNWGHMHDGLIKEFSKFQKASMFKVPKGEYYAHN
ncbi:tetratricopeptide repeat protein [Arachidicoccus terrestris]|uniref:tetratricopeptide repeat protein n=1 Tax=Arachidicoccus terrestris TaxID=2875539 RepID=UPI001CC5CF9B|nr:hypothetical protein [Arachidicoccus terrestris]UAY56790.1 hypothetical protein K9M52_07310 [Arachidicoccus terrestris]